MDDIELQFSKLNLVEGDSLLVKVNVDGSNEELLAEKLKEVSQNGLVEYVRDKGHAVIITHSGIDFQILRLQENDKVMVYVNLDFVEEDQRQNYLNLIEEKLVGIKNDYVLVPIMKDAIRVRVSNKENEE